METRPYSWVALDPECEHPGSEYYPRFPKKQLCDDYDCKCRREEEFIQQELEQVNLNKQLSDETIIIKDSCNIRVSSEDTQVVTSVLTSIQTAIVTVVLAIIDDFELAELVSQDLLQVSANKQTNRQKLVIDNSRDVVVSTEDTDVATLVTTAVQTLTVIIATLIVGIL
ncbi:spore coat protein [Bacillus sp. JJ675]|uniref:spore coat protein n=1 Tax=Bacillus sp. JJ675 TaxID=3122972 RepID=UPI002FFF1C07